MLTLQLPTLLALLATALMAVVIFAPERTAARPTISLAPPLAPASLADRRHSDADSFLDSDSYLDFNSAFHRDSFPDTDSLFDVANTAVPRAPAWPALVDPRAAGCDAGARLALVEALLAVGTPWSHSILDRVLDDESDPHVRSAVMVGGVGERDEPG